MVGGNSELDFDRAVANSLADSDTSKVGYEISTADSIVGRSNSIAGGNDKSNYETAIANSLADMKYQLTDKLCHTTDLKHQTV
jgi:hypothetical protein